MWDIKGHCIGLFLKKNYSIMIETEYMWYHSPIWKNNKGEKFS